MMIEGDWKQLMLLWGLLEEGATETVEEGEEQEGAK